MWIVHCSWVDNKGEQFVRKSELFSEWEKAVDFAQRLVCQKSRFTHRGNIPREVSVVVRYINDKE